MEIISVLREAAKFEPDVVYERRFLPKVSVVVSALRSVPALVEINGLVEDEMEMQGRKPKSALPPPLRDYLIRATFQQLDGIVAVTAGLAREMARQYGAPMDRISVIENAANTALFRPLDKVECRRRLGLGDSGRIVCFEGGLYPWHGVDTLLRAVKLIAEGGQDLRVVIVGTGPSREGLEALARSLSLGSNALFVGRVPYEDVPLYIGACDMGVGPFTRERNDRIGLSPIKVYEYVACGRPVVVSRIPGVADWIETERLGLTADPGDPEDFALRIVEVLRDDDMMRSMVERGPAAVAERHSWDSVARRILSLCSKAIKGD